jgi:hypothetical protein
MKAFELGEREQFIIDLRDDEERKQIRHNLPSYTLDPTTEVYADRAQLVYRYLSKSVWFPSIYQLQR